MKLEIEERVFHFRQPAGTSRGVYHERRSWLVRASGTEAEEPGGETAGRCSGGRAAAGVGECAPLPDLSCDARSDYGEVLRRFCDEVEQTGQIPYEALRDYPSMLFGLETALLPPSNTAFSRGEVGIPINGLVWMGTYEEMLARMEQKLEQGFRCVKLKIGAIDFDRELDLIKSIRQRFSHHEVELRLDANGAFPFEEALYKLELLSQYNIHSIEQPIRQGQWSPMAELCRESPLPIALDEELIGVNDPDLKRQLLNTIRPQYIVLKPSLHGGMMGIREWVALARDMQIGSWITSALESNVGLKAVAELCADIYGDRISMPQGLGTGQLFTDNIPMPLEIRGDELWTSKNS